MPLLMAHPSLEAMTSTSWNPESLGFDVQDAMSPYTVYEIHNYKDVRSDSWRGR